ncbi:MAG: 50S ribosomal protein L6 [Candidatus Babeliales bacterium]
MSKIGRRPIGVKDVQITIDGQNVSYKGKLDTGTYMLPAGLSAELLDGDKIKLNCSLDPKEGNRIWGLHRALLANRLIGASTGFVQDVKIVGLGFKGVLKGKSVDFSLGYSHKIDFEIPKGIAIEIDKTGQILTVKGSNKELVGSVCAEIREMRPPEPYKGTGVRVGDEVILRKAGKTKSS